MFLLAGALSSIAIRWAPVALAGEHVATQHPRRVSQADFKPDVSGHERIGVASFYAKSFSGKAMADGAPMDPHGSNAASKTLPLGTVAKVTNLESGKSAVVRIEDRGPYVEGRIVDLSPTTARKIGISRRQGISRVAVAPIAVPLPDGRVKPGVAADHSASTRPREPRRSAVAETSARSTTSTRKSIRLGNANVKSRSKG